MTSINPSINFAASSAEAARIAAAERQSAEMVANQLRQTGEQKGFPIGSTVTARYQYQVGPDGALIPVQTQTTTTAPDESSRKANRNGRQGLRDGLADRRPSFSDLAKPKPELSPTDEIELFSGQTDTASVVTALRASLTKLANQTPPTVTLAQATAEARDENGEAVDAELLTPEGEPILVRNEALLGDFTARAKFAVAGLYARNSNTVYSVPPITRFAA